MSTLARAPLGAIPGCGTSSKPADDDTKLWRRFPRRRLLPLAAVRLIARPRGSTSPLPSGEGRPPEKGEPFFPRLRPGSFTSSPRRLRGFTHYLLVLIFPFARRRFFIPIFILAARLPSTKFGLIRYILSLSLSLSLSSPSHAHTLLLPHARQFAPSFLTCLFCLYYVIFYPLCNGNMTHYLFIHLILGFFKIPILY
jgi:hypothetical protein